MIVVVVGMAEKTAHKKNGGNSVRPWDRLARKYGMAGMPSSIMEIAEQKKMKPETIRTSVTTYRNTGEGKDIVKGSVRMIPGMMAGAMDEVTISGTTTAGNKVSVTVRMQGGEYVEVNGKKPGEVHYVNDGGTYRPAMAGDWEDRNRITGNGTKVVEHVPHAEAEKSYRKKYGQDMPYTGVFV